MNKTKHAVDHHIDGEPSTDSQKATSATGAKSEPVRRALIRATLKPNNVTQAISRTAPVFTMHEQPRGSNGTNRTAKRFQTNKKTIRAKSSRKNKNNDRNGQSKSERSARLAPSRNGKNRSR